MERNEGRILAAALSIKNLKACRNPKTPRSQISAMLNVQRCLTKSNTQPLTCLVWIFSNKELYTDFQPQ